MDLPYFFDNFFNFTNLRFLETLHANLPLVLISIFDRPSLGLIGIRIKELLQFMTSKYCFSSVF